MNQEAKADYGKPRLSLVPSEIIRAIAVVAENVDDIIESGQEYRNRRR